jgi:SAM-dependent methyltransferase
MTRAADLARYYDLDLLTDPGDLPLYVGLAAKVRGPILELAVGSGRFAVALAAAGHDVTGVDNDAAMLDRARAKWQSSVTGGAPGRTGSLTLIEHDLLTLDLPHRFDLVFVALNSLLLLDGREPQQKALKAMRRHLAPGGRAVLDVWLPTNEDLALYDGREVLEWVRTDPETGERVAKTSSATYDPSANTALLTTTFDGEGRIARQDKISFIGARELVDMASAAGLEPETVAGDYDLSPWSEASERVVLVLRESG